jgi:hypothetical protein
MQNVKATVSLTLETDKGEVMHRAPLEYFGLDEGGVLFIERHLIEMLSAMNHERSAMLNRDSNK